MVHSVRLSICRQGTYGSRLFHTRSVPYPRRVRREACTRPGLQASSRTAPRSTTRYPIRHQVLCIVLIEFLNRSRPDSSGKFRSRVFPFSSRHQETHPPEEPVPHDVSNSGARFRTGEPAHTRSYSNSYMTEEKPTRGCPHLPQPDHRNLETLRLLGNRGVEALLL